MNFKDLGLGSKILMAIKELGYETPTPIQEKAIPFALNGRDLVGSAQTGTGRRAYRQPGLRNGHPSDGPVS